MTVPSHADGQGATLGVDGQVTQLDGARGDRPHRTPRHQERRRRREFDDGAVNCRSAHACQYDDQHIDGVVAMGRDRVARRQHHQICVEALG